MDKCDELRNRIPNLLKQFQEESNALFCARESWVATLPFPNIVGLLMLICFNSRKGFTSFGGLKLVLLRMLDLIMDCILLQFLV